MAVPTKTLWCLCVLLLAVVPLASSRNARSSGRVECKHEPNVENAESRSVPLRQTQLLMQPKRLMHTNIQDFVRSQRLLVKPQAVKLQYAALWKFDTPLSQVNAQQWVYSPPLAIQTGSVFSPPASSVIQNWLTVTTTFENGRLVHTEETIQRLLESGLLKLDENGKSFLLHSYFSICKDCAPRVCAIFELLKTKGIEEGMVTFEQIYAGYEESLDTLNKCGIEMLQYKEQ